MSFSYDSTLSSTRDYLRFLLDDKVEATAQFQNEEIDGVIARYGSSADIYFLAYELAMNQYTQATRQAIDYAVGVTGVNEVVSIDRRKIPEFWLKLAEHFKTQIAATPHEVIDTFDFVIDSYGRDVSEYVGDTRDVDC